jgi:hypoxanthine phosphoribosyltransferase
MKKEKVLFTKERIKRMVRELGKRITDDYAGEELVLIGVLKGAFVFMGDLVREITLPLEVDFIGVSSYGDSTASTGVVKITKDFDTEIVGRNVIIVEDIVDTGLTLSYLYKLIQDRNPKSLRVCSAFNKPSRRVKDVEVHYSGLEVPDEFIIGYGLDFMGKYRNEPCIKVIEVE